jgi:hypothetical protein
MASPRLLATSCSTIEQMRLVNEGVVRVSGRVFQILLPEAQTPERCLEAYHLHRTRLELIAERKVRRRQLIDDGNVENTGRDLREREVQVRPHGIGYRQRGGL